MAKTTVEERFWSKVHGVVETRCLEWTAYLDPRGYGRFCHEGDMRYAHRVAWYLEHGQWPEHTIDHLCRNRACVNVDHLDDVPNAENVRRGEAGINYSSRTHCGNGHEFDPENTYLRPNSNGRGCRECARESKRRYRDRKRAEAQNGA